MKYPTSLFFSASSFSSPPRAVRWGCFVVLVLAVVTSWWPSSSSTLGGVAATNLAQNGECPPSVGGSPSEPSSPPPLPHEGRVQGGGGGGQQDQIAVGTDTPTVAVAATGAVRDEAGCPVQPRPSQQSGPFPQSGQHGSSPFGRFGDLADVVAAVSYDVSNSQPDQQEHFSCCVLLIWVLLILYSLDIIDEIVTGFFVAYWTGVLWENSEYDVSNVAAAVSDLLSDEDAWTWFVFGLLVILIDLTHRLTPCPSEASPSPPPSSSPKYRAVYPEVIQGLGFKIIEKLPPVLYAPPPLIKDDGSYPPCDFLRRDLPMTMDDAKPGHDVTFRGLQGDDAHLNGTTGTLVKYFEHEARWTVRRRSDGSLLLDIVKVEPDNLEPLTVNNKQLSWKDTVAALEGLVVVVSLPLAAQGTLAVDSLRVLMWTVAVVHLVLWDKAKSSAVLPAPPPQHEGCDQGGSGGEQQDELPEEVRLNILNYLSNEDKMTASMLGQQPYRDCHVSNGLERPIVTTCTFRPIQQTIRMCIFSLRSMEDDRRGIRLLQQLGDHQHDPRKKQTLQDHRRIKIENMHQFGMEGVSSRNVYALARRATMMGVTNLDLSVATQHTVFVSHSFVKALLLMLPNLRVLNLTNIALEMFSDLWNVVVFCPDLEKIIWNNNYGWDDTLLRTETVGFKYFNADGSVFRDSPNLKEIEMNNCRFICFHFDAWWNDPNKFLFYHCSENLERVSIKNATYERTARTIPQAELVKFVQNVPSLRYFSSDLTPDNIAMLQLERPDIVFE